MYKTMQDGFDHAFASYDIYSEQMVGSSDKTCVNYEWKCQF